MEKDAAHFQSAQDLAFAIHALSGSSASTPAEAAPHTPSRRKPWLAIAAAGAGILAGIFGVARVAAVPAVDIGKQHHTLLVSESAAIMMPRWAPDGKSFTYTSSSQLLVQNLDAAVPTMVHPDPVLRRGCSVLFARWLAHQVHGAG